MSIRKHGIAVFAAILPASSAIAQTNFPEVEPNSLKTEATLVNGITAGDSITGTTTGTDITAGSTLVTTADVFRVKTAALPLGLYRHRLALTSSPTAHTTTLRGLNQTGTVGVGGIAGTIDTAIGTSISTAAPFNLWYGFGKQEEIYYRVTGAATTTAAYAATLTTTAITPTVIAPAFESTAPITITTKNQTTADTELLLYDSTWTPVPNGLNDGTYLESIAHSTLTRTLAPGTYFLAVSTFELGSNQVAPADDNYTGGTLLDFPDAVALSSASTLSQDWDFQIRACNGTVTQSNQSPVNAPFEVTWFQFTVAPGAAIIAAPANDACAAAQVLTAGVSVTANLATATNDGAATCDPGGAASKDVWYSFTNTLTGASQCKISTCGTTDTVLTVFNGCGGSEVACSDDCGGTPCSGPGSCVTVILNPSQNVLVRVSDKGIPTCGEFTLALTNVLVPPPPPANDDCSTPTSISGFGLFPINTLGATTGTQGQTEALCNQFGSGMAQDVWYTWTATGSGTVEVTTCGLIASGPSQDSHIAVYNGSGCPVAGSAIACNDDSLTGCTGFSSFNARTTFTAVCGNVYTIQMGMYPFTTLTMAGQFSVTLTLPGGPSCSTPFTVFCEGNAVGTTCVACGNNGGAGRGCANSGVGSTGAMLVSGGIASVGSDTMTLTCSDMTGPGLFFQANGLAGSPIGFGDGMLCAAIGIIRMGVVFPTAGSATYPGGLTPNPIHIAGAPVAAGDLKHYQVWYRDAVAFCTASTFNTSNGVSLTWTP